MSGLEDYVNDYTMPSKQLIAQRSALRGNLGEITRATLEHFPNAEASQRSGRYLKFYRDDGAKIQLIASTWGAPATMGIAEIKISTKEDRIVHEECIRELSVARTILCLFFGGKLDKLLNEE